MKFWLNNRLDQEYALRFDELVGAFKGSEFCRCVDPEMPWPIERRMAAFLTERKYGTWEPGADFETLCEAALEMERNWQLADDNDALNTFAQKFMPGAK